MMNYRKLSVTLRPGSAMHVTRVSIGKHKLVYVLVVPKPQHYLIGRSRIIYVGTTKTGISRIAQSVAARADKALSIHGVKSFDVRVVTCAPRQRVKTWHVLERALLIKFREMHGTLPKLNKRGAKSQWRDEGDYFSMDRIESILKELS
jgi:hypothetical protein